MTLEPDEIRIHPAPEPLYWDDFGSPVYPEPGPAVTITDDSPYRAEVMQDEPTRCDFW